MTDRRLMFLEQGHFKDKLDEFPYDRVATISTEKKMMSGKVKFSVSGGGQHEITNVMPKERVEEIAGYVPRRISPAAQPAPAMPAPSEPPQAASDVAGRLAKLSELKDQGLITEEEFKQKRAALIEQL